jgi:PIN domain nuclease of toxin-antitoxin system
MRLLLDTHVLLWSLVAPERLSADARMALETPENAIFFSAASIWAIAIKRALERPDFDAEPEQIRSAALATGFDELRVNGVPAVRCPVAWVAGAAGLVR